MRTKCYSVRLQSLTSISDKCYKAISFDGTEALIPKSQVFGQDYEVIKSDAYWISAWILEQKELQYSCKKEAFFDTISGRKLPNIIVYKHIPSKVDASKTTPHESLIR